MTASRHIIISFSLGAVVGFMTKSLYAGIICFIAGFLIDLDHVIEYVIHYGWENFTIAKFYQACEQTGKKHGTLGFQRLYLIFHSIELMFSLWIIALFTKNIYVFAFTMGYSVHLLCDCLGNRHLYTSSYLIAVRAIKKFRTVKLFKKY
ncbi:MAG: hypothetical protein ABH952_02600 [Candidatus Omnitrophota bacterium]